MSITSEEVNLLIYRYLLESGFRHSAFTFSNETTINKSILSSVNVPRGALITYLQKALQYVEVETHLNDKGEEIECKEHFSLTSEHQCKPTGIVSRKRKKIEGKEKGAEKEKKEEKKEKVVQITSDGISKLKGHKGEVFNVAWSPTQSLLATVSADLSARIWSVPEGPSGSASGANASTNFKLLDHSNPQKPNVKKGDVTTVRWRKDGKLLATGAYDGIARIWSVDGRLVNSFTLHKGPLFNLKFNKSGNYLASASVDKTSAVWEVNTGLKIRHFSVHTAPALDIDWKDEESFVSCSSDRQIYLFRLNHPSPLHKFTGHENEVNQVKWDGQGRLLASCSDDKSLRLWSIDHEYKSQTTMTSSYAISTFSEHSKEIYTIEWSPSYSLIASASFDKTAKLWDPNRSSSLRTLRNHTNPIYSLSFSPDGKYLVSGSFDKKVNIWSVHEGQLVKQLQGSSGVFNVDWSPDGNKIACCYADSSVNVFDFRM